MKQLCWSGSVGLGSVLPAALCGSVGRLKYSSWDWDGIGHCWGPSSSEGPQKHDLTMFSEWIM
jgi:hypothetical protein